jgi:hypothetical protein
MKCKKGVQVWKRDSSGVEKWVKTGNSGSRLIRTGVEKKTAYLHLKSRVCHVLLVNVDGWV